MTTTQTSLVDTVVEVLTDLHPQATVKVDEPGACDFRVCSLGSVTAVVECGDDSLTTDDIMQLTMPEHTAESADPVDYAQSANHHLFWRR